MCCCKYIQIFKILLIGFSFLLLNNCGGPVRNFSYQIRSGALNKLNNAKSINFKSVTCQDSIIAKVVKNLIIQELLSTKISLKKDSTADIQIEITITLASDAAGGGNSIATHAIGGGNFASSAGSYISGINALFIKSNHILASATVSQSRTTSWIPDAPEEISRIIARKIICILTTRGYCEYE